MIAVTLRRWQMLNETLVLGTKQALVFIWRVAWKGDSIRQAHCMLLYTRNRPVPPDPADKLCM
jgi:hypothetical protein